MGWVSDLRVRIAFDEPSVRFRTDFGSVVFRQCSSVLLNIVCTGYCPDINRWSCLSDEPLERFSLVDGMAALAIWNSHQRPQERSQHFQWSFVWKSISSVPMKELCHRKLKKKKNIVSGGADSRGANLSNWLLQGQHGETKLLISAP